MKSYLKLILIAITLYGGIASAQVGMTGNAPDKSAALDINATNKGVLIPNVNLLSLTDKASITGGNPITSLMVYNTNTSLTYGEGYYYWDGSSWQKLVQPGNSDNLGNHTATQNLQMGSNLISNQGTAGQGLGFDTTGNGTFNQKLNVKSVATSAAGDKTLKIGSDGVVKAEVETTTTAASAIFKYTLTNDITFDANSGKIKFNKKLIDKSNLVSATVNNSGSYSVFTAPKTGFYFFSINVYQFCGSSGVMATPKMFNARISLRNETTGDILANSIENLLTTAPYYWGTQILYSTVKLNSGDRLSVEFANNFNNTGYTNRTMIAGDGPQHPEITFFSGFFISE
ncbi:hypothetical protein [uncultured Flavobacterium sp.]|uniref:hypothetical protein n=1 Tax=uncultured Flavobacterium sp. TaxID=165435 RepID=UPI00292E1478|nr:hypothetical protein [uncultured Flavobacterium sp.]